MCVCVRAKAWDCVCACSYLCLKCLCLSLFTCMNPSFTYSLLCALTGQLAESKSIEVRYHSPEEEICYGPSCWLWDYLRRFVSSERTKKKKNCAYIYNIFVTFSFFLLHPAVSFIRRGMVPPVGYGTICAGLSRAKERKRKKIIVHLYFLYLFFYIFSFYSLRYHSPEEGIYDSRFVSSEKQTTT